MSKLEKKSRLFMSKQRNLFDLLEEKEMEVKMDIAEEIREIISNAIKESGLTRYQVAARMSEILHKDITKAQLDAWSAESKEKHRFPLEYTPAFCHSVKNYDLIELTAHSLRIEIILPEDAEEARLIMAKMELEKAAKRVKEMEQRLKRNRR